MIYFRWRASANMSWQWTSYTNAGRSRIFLVWWCDGRALPPLPGTVPRHQL